MGQALTRETKYERIKTLEDLHRKILSKKKSANIWRRNKPVANIVIPFVIVTSTVVLYFVWPDDIAGKIYGTLILIAVVLILLLFWKFWLRYCGKNIERIKTDVAKLNAEKQCELEKVMETETYNVAQELLLKYGQNLNSVI